MEAIKREGDRGWRSWDRELGAQLGLKAKREGSLERKSGEKMIVGGEEGVKCARYRK